MRLTLDIIPHGLTEFRKEIARLDIVNDGTGDKRTGSYDVYLKYKGDKSALCVGKVEAYNRNEPVFILLSRALELINHKQVKN